MSKMLVVAATAAASAWLACDVPPDEQRSQDTGNPLCQPRQPPSVALPEGLTGIETRSRVIQDQTYPMNVFLDASTVLCSSADYGATFLKVAIPDVAKVTLFDHRNTGVNAPCIAAGECTSELGPESILDPCDQDEDIELRVLVTGQYTLDHDNQTCTVSLEEELFATIRAIDFYHRRDGFLTERPYVDCLGI